MSEPNNQAVSQPETPAGAADHGPRQPWITCLTPLVTYMLAGALLPSAEGGGLAGSLGIPFSAYPWAYALQVVATLVAIGWCWRDLAAWLGRPSWWPPLLGVALVVPWVVLATLQRDAGWDFGFGARAGFNPFASLGEGTPATWAFLAVRALGLVVAVPIAEEVFLRGFLMRTVVNEEFWRVPFGTLTAAAAVRVT